MSRASIAKLTGISRPTISESAQRLVKLGLVNETKRKTQNKQGRAGIIYEINASKGIILALAIDVKQIQLRLTNLPSAWMVIPSTTAPICNLVH